MMNCITESIQFGRVIVYLSNTPDSPQRSNVKQLTMRSCITESIQFSRVIVYFYNNMYNDCIQKINIM